MRNSFSDETMNPANDDNREVQGIKSCPTQIIERLRNSNKVLDNLVKMSFDPYVMQEQLIEACTEAICHTLSVGRAGVWIFNGGRESIIAHDIYEHKDMSHSKGAILNAEDAPTYFAALNKERNIVCDDVNNDPRMVELQETYFPTHHTTSLLDCPIRSASGVYGVLCTERIKSQKTWTEDEITFASAVAGLLALAIESEYLRSAHNRIRQMTQFDELTGLGNRSYFHENLKTAWDCSSSSKTSLHLYLLSIDDFRHINDQFGQETGDTVLTMIAQRLERVCNKKAQAKPYRLGGDEYACIVRGLSEKETHFFGRTLARVVSFPHTEQNREIRVNCSIGCATKTEKIGSIRELMSAADMALQVVKKKSDTSFASYSAELENKALKNKLLETDLILAIQNIDTEMNVVIQPIVESQDHNIIGGELLLRWKNRRLGEFIPPDHFIAMAEEKGLVSLIDTHMFSKALDLVEKWNLQGQNLKLNVNISPATLTKMNIVQSIDKLLRLKEDAAKQIRLEVTEGIEMLDDQRMIHIFTEIRKRGLQIYIDDFGSGHTGLSYFTNIPVDGVKVDKCLTQKYLTCPKTEVIIKSIMELAKSFGIRTVIEGVETLEEASTLSQFGGNVSLQGYYFDKPMPLAEFEKKYVNTPSAKNKTKNLA